MKQDASKDGNRKKTLLNNNLNENTKKPSSGLASLKKDKLPEGYTKHTINEEAGPRVSQQLESLKAGKLTKPDEIPDALFLINGESE